jgi:hypothetical protein
VNMDFQGNCITQKCSRKERLVFKGQGKVAWLYSCDIKYVESLLYYRKVKKMPAWTNNQ